MSLFLKSKRSKQQLRAAIRTAIEMASKQVPPTKERAPYVIGWLFAECDMRPDEALALSELLYVYTHDAERNAAQLALLGEADLGHD